MELGGPHGEVPAGRVLFRAASRRTGLARFRASGSLVITNTEHRFGALHSAYLPVSLVSESPVPLRPAIGVTVSLAGRDSGDYYGHSVTAGLASRPVIPRSSLPYVVSVR